MKIAVLLLALGLTACESILPTMGEKNQEIVNKRLIGVSVGDFLDRYGAPLSRREAVDGTPIFDWERARPATMGTGPGGPPERCRLRIAADKSGRIVSALIMFDGSGEARFSLCAELFS